MTTTDLMQSMAGCTYTADCRTRAAADRLSNKWVGLIVFCLIDRPHHFGELHRRIEGISRKVLTQSLRALERDSLVLRTSENSGNLTAVRYSLTPLGESFSQPLTAFYGWMERHSAIMDAGHSLYEDLNFG